MFAGRFAFHGAGTGIRTDFQVVTRTGLWATVRSRGRSGRHRETGVDTVPMWRLMQRVLMDLDPSHQREVGVLNGAE